MNRKTLCINRAFAVSAFVFMLPAGALAMTMPAAHLESHAMVKRAAAEAAALSRVPGGTLKSAQFEKEHGKPVWSFAVATPHATRVKRVIIDAQNGKILLSKFESRLRRD